MTTIVTRSSKGSPLTHAEVDANFTNLDNDKLDAAGIASGTAASPAIKFTGDTNTGIYRPGADQVAISTAGTGRLFVNASGRVGIGTASPGVPLEVSDAGTPQIKVARPTGVDLRLNAYYANADLASLSVVTNHPLAFHTNNTERARIDSSGRLLVGTSSSPTLGQGFSSLCVVQGFQGGPTGLGLLSLQIGQAATALAADTTIGRLAFNDNAGSTFAWIQAAVDGAVSSSTDLPGRLVFSTTADGASSPTERMRIWANGAVSINTTTQPSVSSFGTFIGRGGNVGLIENRRNVTGSEGVLSCGGSVGQALIMGDGDLENTNNSYGGISDAKLKENVTDAAPQWSDIRSLRVRKYNFKEQTGFSTHTQIGLIAQEVELISPGLVSESPDRDAEGNDLGTVTKSVNYSVLYMKAVKALQEAMERIETLEAKVAALESA